MVDTVEFARHPVFLPVSSSLNLKQYICTRVSVRVCIRLKEKKRWFLQEKKVALTQKQSTAEKKRKHHKGRSLYWEGRVCVCVCCETRRPRAKRTFSTEGKKVDSECAQYFVNSPVMAFIYLNWEEPGLCLRQVFIRDGKEIQRWICQKPRSDQKLMVHSGTSHQHDKSEILTKFPSNYQQRVQLPFLASSVALGVAMTALIGKTKVVNIVKIAWWHLITAEWIIGQ